MSFQTPARQSPQRSIRPSYVTSPPSGNSTPVKRASPGRSNLRSAASISSSTPDLSGTATGRRFGTPGRTGLATGSGTPARRISAASSRPASSVPTSGSRTLPRKSTQAAQARAQAKTRSNSSSSTPVAHTTRVQQQQHIEHQQHSTPSPDELNVSAELGDESVLTPQAASQHAVSSVAGARRGGPLPFSTPVAVNSHNLDDLTVSCCEHLCIMHQDLSY